jgi:allophanate hydrolase subunit 2
MCAALYTVDPNSNRIALRLRGNTVRRAVSDEVPPEGLIPGAIQIPPDGQPVLFLADHPVTGGYPVIGVIDRADVCQTAQLRPGQTLRFAVSPGDQRRTRR